MAYNRVYLSIVHACMGTCTVVYVFLKYKHNTDFLIVCLKQERNTIVKNDLLRK